MQKQIEPEEEDNLIEYSNIIVISYYFLLFNLQNTDPYGPYYKEGRLSVLV